MVAEDVTISRQPGGHPRFLGPLSSSPLCL
jgi:hypothetical protein